MKRILISIFSLTTLGTAAFADGDAAKGAVVFKKCAACHAVTDKTNRVGPSLFGILDRPAGTVEGYKYSESMLAYGSGGGKWDVASLDAYLTDPKAVVPKGKMTFAGLKKEDERKDVIAYLATLK